MTRFLILLVVLFFTSRSVSAHHRKDCTGPSDLGNYFINFCEEKCICEQTSAGDYAHVCYREREEFTCMSITRRQRFLNAYLAISNPGSPQYDQFAELIGIHKSSNFGAIHSTQYFLPWHRWYIMALEDLLRNEDCRVTVPWWRWSKKSATWWTGTPFSSGGTWLGTDGTSPSQCVNDGAFAVPWGPPGDVCLKHDFTLNTMPTGAQIANVLSMPSGSFSAFSNSLENTIHNSPHVRIGGHMSTANSPKSPAFFLHHAYIDKLWDQWQKTSPAHLNSYDAFPMNHQLIETYGTTPSNVQDHFDLEQSRVRYVTVKSNPAGPGHFVLLPVCLWIFQWPNVFSLRDLELGLNKLAKEGSLYRIPQKPFPLEGLDSLKRDFRWWLEGQTRSSSVLLEKKIESMFERMKEANDKLEDPRESFEDEASKMVGYDIEAVAKAANVCPLGSRYDARLRKCVRDRLGLREFMSERRKVKFVGAEAVYKEHVE